MGAYGSPELHPNLNNQPAPEPKHQFVECKKCHAIYSNAFHQCPQCGYKAISSGKIISFALLFIIISIGMLIFAFNNDLFDKYIHPNNQISTQSTNNFANESDNINQKENSTTSTTSNVMVNSFESVYNIYSEKVKALTPIIIDDYKAKASLNTKGVNGLVEIGEYEVQKLTDLCQEGINKMKDLYYDYGSGKQSEAQAWIDKLASVYDAELEKFNAMYTASAK